MAMSRSPTKDHKIYKRTVITAETIKQREELQKSVLKHTNRLINQLLKNLDEADNVIKKKLSPSHLQRLIDYLRDDIQPLRGFINKISLHAENLGTLKKEYELQGASGEPSLHNLSFSTTASESNSSFTRYMFDRRARAVSDENVNSPSPPYHTPRLSPAPQPVDGYVSKSCSPIRFDKGDINVSRKDSSEQVDMDEMIRERLDVTQVVDVSRYAIAREIRQVYKAILCWMLFWKYRITGSQRVGIIDCLFLIVLLWIFYRGSAHLLDHCWRIFKSSRNMRRGVKPM